MPHHYFLHKLNVHPRFHHIKKHLPHFSKTHPKSHGGALVRAHHHKIMHHPHAMHTMARGMHHLPPNPGMHILAAGVHHKKRLHPLKFKI